MQLIIELTAEIYRPEDIVGLAWIDCGALVVAAGNQIRCYLKWLTADDHIQQGIVIARVIKIGL